MSAGEGLLWTRRWDLLRKLSDPSDRLCDGKTASFAKVGFQLYWTAWQAWWEQFIGLCRADLPHTLRSWAGCEDTWQCLQSKLSTEQREQAAAAAAAGGNDAPGFRHVLVWVSSLDRKIVISKKYLHTFYLLFDFKKNNNSLCLRCSVFWINKWWHVFVS